MHCRQVRLWAGPSWSCRAPALGPLPCNASQMSPINPESQKPNEFPASVEPALPHPPGIHLMGWNSLPWAGCLQWAAHGWAAAWGRSILLNIWHCAEGLIWAKSHPSTRTLTQKRGQEGREMLMGLSFGIYVLSLQEEHLQSDTCSSPATLNKCV